MADRPILFSAPMVCALLAGTKTQTRRILKPQPRLFQLKDGRDCLVTLTHVAGDRLPRIALGSESAGVITLQEVRFAVGDRLWVRETWEENYTGMEGLPPHYRADLPADPNDAMTENHAFGLMKWKPSIFMPRWASRLTLTVTDVRVQKLQDISEEDACAEGWPSDENDPICWYAKLWGHINGPDSWDSNPWIVALTFGVRKGNIDGREHKDFPA